MRGPALCPDDRLSPPWTRRNLRPPGSDMGPRVGLIVVTTCEQVFVVAAVTTGNHSSATISDEYVLNFRWEAVGGMRRRSWWVSVGDWAYGDRSHSDGMQFVHPRPSRAATRPVPPATSAAPATGAPIQPVHRGASEPHGGRPALDAHREQLGDPHNLHRKRPTNQPRLRWSPWIGERN